MQLIANEQHIKTRTRIGEIAPFGGMIVLVVAMVLIFWQPELVWATMVIIWVGFVISLIGGYLSSRYLGPLAHYKKVPEVLKGLENSYTLLVYRTPAPFVLVDPGGVTVILVRSQGGRVIYRKDRWRHKEKLGGLKRFAGQEGLGRPDRLAALDEESFRRYLYKRIPEEVDIPIRSVILFVNPDIVLDVEDAPIPVFRSAEFKHWLRRDGRRQRLSVEVLQQLSEALEIEA